jgi:hypothetical protein
MFGAVGAVVACGLAAAAATFDGGSGSSRGSIARDTSNVQVRAAGGSSVASQDVATTTVGAPGDASCSEGAVLDVSGTSKGAQELSRSSGFSQPAAKDRPSMSRDAAASLARAISVDQEAASKAPAAVVRQPYSEAVRWFDESNPLIAPHRCVWIVTVKASFTPPRHPEGVKVQTASQYDVVIDVSSGDHILTIAGPGVPDMITGANTDAGVKD